ncbi:ABC transporter permease subunit [Microbacterium sp. Yaish 1]|uniref:ABC transporter permease subunit n=1 Tax=Microbacterium sp. Yaish 1 TaxID=2025014 RepID=UPI000B93AD9C|nr:ABC transporter permease subunit [Microbacterium sp. Yaish 1]OYC98521.1 ABC transporter permease [Microbacterium sp. Yaish 1]
MNLVNATRSELTKQFSTSVWWVLLIVLVLYIGGTAGGMAAVFAAGENGSLPGTTSLPTGLGERLPSLIYGLATAMGYVFPLVVGSLLVTGEYRHKTLTPTFLATPRRGVALAAKMIAGIVMGLVFGVAAVGSTVAAGGGMLALFGVDPQLGRPETWAFLGRMLLALVLWVLVGIALGTLIRNQIAAVVGILAFTQFVEPIARVGASMVDGLADVVRFLPGAASDALAGDSIYAAMGGSAGQPLEWWAGGLVLAAYAVVFAVIGYAVSWRRDVA